MTATNILQIVLIVVLGGFYLFDYYITKRIAKTQEELRKIQEYEIEVLKYRVNLIETPILVTIIKHPMESQKWKDFFGVKE